MKPSVAARAGAVQPAKRVPLPQLRSDAPVPKAVRLGQVSREEQSVLSEGEHSTRIGVNRPLGGKALETGEWTPGSPGGRVWRVRIQGDGAAGLRLHFQNFHVGQGQAWLHTGARDHGQTAGPFTGSGMFGDGDFWTELLFGESVYLEYWPADAAADSVPFEVPEVFHAWKVPAQGPVRPQAVDTGCFLNASCYDHIPAVHTGSLATVYLVFSDHTCSGTMLNDRNSTGTPYLLTAGHCVNTASQAREMLSVFRYQTLSCSSATAPYIDYVQFPMTAGATLLAWSYHVNAAGQLLTDQPDFAFLTLTSNARVPLYAGSNANVGMYESLYSVSHPRNLAMTFAKAQVLNTGIHFLTLNVLQGAVDHGSSGSGLFNELGALGGLMSYVQNEDSVSACSLADRKAGATKFASIYPAISTWMEAAAPPASGTLSANPNPVRIADGTGNGQTVLTWAAARVAAVEVHEGSPAGNRIAAGGLTGQLTTGKSVRDGTVFYLQNVSNGLPLTAANTLSAVKVQVIDTGGTPAVISSPSAGTVLSGSSATFSWGTVGALSYRLDLGITGVGSANLFSQTTSSTSLTVNNLPTDGRTIYARLTSNFASGPRLNDYSYTAFRAVPQFTAQIGTVVNTAGQRDRLTSGAWMTIYGTGLARSSAGWSDFSGGNLPTAINGVSVLVNGRKAYVGYVSPAQINFIAPADNATGSVSVQVVEGTAASNSVAVQKWNTAPAFFAFSQGGNRYPVASFPNGQFDGPPGLLGAGTLTRPARPGEVLALWMTGLGQTLPAYPEGRLVTSSAPTAIPASVSVGGLNAQVEFAGIVGAGLYQVNFRVPSLPAGDHSIQLTIGGQNGQGGLFISVQP